MISIKYLIMSLAQAYCVIIFIYVLMSWLPTDRGILAHSYSVLGKRCDPYLTLFKRLIPPIGGMVDVTPILALLVLQFAVSFILRLL